MTRPTLAKDERSVPRPHTALVAWLFVLLVAFSVILIGIAESMRLVTDSCAQRVCNETVVAISGYFTPVAVIVIVIVAVTVTTWKSGRRQSIWWVPAAAVVAVFAAFFVGWALLAAGTHLTFGEFFGPIEP